jgi:hypothetical protein
MDRKGEPMTTEGRIQAKRITDETGRDATLLLLAAAYEKEKGWITEPNSQFPSSHLELPNVSWYMVWLDRQPVTLLLDLKSSYHRLKARGNWVYRYLTANWPEDLHRCLAA